MVVAPAVVEGVSGALGGIAALLTTYPLMTISTLQATRSKQVLSAVRSLDKCNAVRAQPPFNISQRSLQAMHCQHMPTQSKSRCLPGNGYRACHKCRRQLGSCTLQPWRCFSCL